MTPTVLRVGALRFFFFSREECRPHVHVQSSRGEAKFWLEPAIELAQDRGLGRRDVARALRILREREQEVRAAWEAWFHR
jgi:hypothetical protein